MKQRDQNSPFLYDETTGRIAGVRQPDNSADNFMLLHPTVGTPVDGVKAALTSDMTNANADVTLTAVNYGSAGNGISVVYVNPSANSQSLTVLVNGLAIRVLLATNGSGTITSTATLVVAAINAHAAASALVVATAEGSGAGVVNAKSVAYLAGGVTCTKGVPGSSFMVSADGKKIYAKATAQTWVQAAGTDAAFTGSMAGALAGTTLGLTSVAITATGAMPTSTGTFIQLNHATVKIAATMAIEAGRLYIITQADTGTAGHTVTLSAGTFDGTNTVATFNAQYETLVVFGVAAGRGVIVANIGSVGLA